MFGNERILCGEMRELALKNNRAVIAKVTIFFLIKNGYKYPVYKLTTDLSIFLFNLAFACRKPAGFATPSRGPGS
jgi:hypothetical protein